MNNKERIDENNGELNIIKSMLENKSSIIERIENENGTALKFYDGTMIQYGFYDLGSNIAFNKAYGSVYHCGEKTLTFPTEFVEAPKIQATIQLKGGIGGVGISGVPTISNFKVFPFHVMQYTFTSDCGIHYEAVGRWK